MARTRDVSIWTLLVAEVDGARYRGGDALTSYGVDYEIKERISMGKQVGEYRITTRPLKANEARRARRDAPDVDAVAPS